MCRAFEAQARQDLENEGCPPCYPPEVDVPLQNPPEKYQAIIEYWKSFAGTAEMALRPQLSNWRAFRAFQLKTRRYYRNISFSKYVDVIQERRQSHNLSGDVRLLLDPEQQSRLGNWIEFQNYHLQRLEDFSKEVGRGKEGVG